MILLVDDSPADVDLFRLALDEAVLDCQLSVIDDGAEALSFLRQAAAGGSSGLPDAIVLDLHLPKCDGLQILEAMAETAALASVPVLVWSSLLLPEQGEQLKRFPFVTSISKPAGLTEFLKVGFSLKKLFSAGE